MKNKIEDLRNHLFATLEALQDEDNPMDIERAKVIAQVSQQVIESAKVEVKFMDVVGCKGSGFIPESPRLPHTPPVSMARLSSKSSG